MKNKFSYLLLWLIVLSFYVPNLGFAQNKLTIDQIMEGENFIGHAPSNVFWSDNGQKIYFNWNPEKQPQSSLYFIAVKNGKPVGKPQKVDSKELVNMPGRFGVSNNKARTEKLYTKNGDIFWLKNGKARQITNTIERESNVSFSGDEKSIIFQKGDNLFEWAIADGTLKQLTNFRKGSPRRGGKSSEQSQWLKKQQLELMDVLKKRKSDRAFRQKSRRIFRVKRPKSIYLKGKRLSRLRLSPNKDFVTFMLQTNPRSSKNTSVMQFITESGYTNPVNRRVKVGSPQSTYEFGIFNLKTNKVKMLDFTQLKGIYEAPAYYKEYKRAMKLKKARKIIPHGPIWSNDGKNAIMVIRALDSKDRWIALLRDGNKITSRT